ncbi:helicase-related protein [Amycolatopsis eburnea]|uniref:DNA helicase n=1 Tax=Amycolatopsis eburnea TaxID=2267691 RepID=A0A427TGM6_9PSEU|nr:helicase-related protein [Amycolatopsis eburnea]RSD22179.1 DNA helicase [Amycolatopsis eburnea]
MTDHNEHYRFRAAMVEGLRRDAVGPHNEHEVLIDPPITTYVAGILFPRTAEQSANPDVDLDLASAEAIVDEQPDTGVAMANVQSPSSMGLTFAVGHLVSPMVRIKVTAAVYESVDLTGRPVEAKRSERRSTEDQGIRWRRRLLPEFTTEIDVAEPEQPFHEVAAGLQLRVRTRPPRKGSVSVTVTLVNTDSVPPGDLKDPHCFFQPEIRVAGTLVERRGPGGGDEEEVKGTRLLYRYAPTFAVGHGCSVVWDWEVPPVPELIRLGGRPAVVAELSTTFVPEHEVLLTDSNDEIEKLGMRKLAQAGDDDLFGALERIVAGYTRWISERRSEVDFLAGSELYEVAKEHLRRCEEARLRIENGVKVLKRDKNALRAFRLANEAMALQRGRSSWIKSGRRGQVRLNGEWRPFQIAFLLQCLDGIVDSEHEDRALVDLLWFPTGGGKTEAYLGLIAFTVFLRRLRKGEEGRGVTAIMRYTLRLLTLQQFERAAALICAMETLRRPLRAELGTTEISLGMWVGRAATPNTLDQAEAALKRLRNQEKLQTENPVQLRNCPWCGTPLDADDYVVDLQLRDMSIKCRSADCAFRDGLPCHVVDEMVYRSHPTLLIATVDKFARLPWREDVAALFNRDATSRGVPPPELIVQDELHLISGPLGSLAGLYETVVDEAAERPKVIASTATIRRAEAQARKLFDREVAQFPPPGLDARDSWFSVEVPRDKKATRLYAGLITPNTSQATLLVRAYAALLHHAAQTDGEDEVRDAYWTLVGYFNSLRLLAAAELHVHDDVQDRLSLLAEKDADVRKAEIVTELTSRVDSSDIPEYLKGLDVALPDAAMDVVLATNMISVGVDIDRLGLMAIMGQPQTTAEYIQASSRVGRSRPGLVVTLFNAARSRDRSHYENFASYHAALYRQVESTSVTPFSARARDRALHAVLVGLARLMIPEARANGAAAGVARFSPRLAEIKALVLARVGSVAPAERPDTAAHLDDIIAHWTDMATENPNLVYEAPSTPGRKRDASAALLRSFTDDDLEEALDTLWSLRDVDAESDLYLER